MNLIYLFFIAIPLAITLIVAAVLDIKYREVRGYTWIPAFILGMFGILSGAYPLTPDFCRVEMINGILTALILTVASLNQIMVTLHKTEKIYFGFADALCIWLICLLKPLTLTMPTIAPLFLIAGLVMCGGFMIPSVAKKWTENTPFMIPLSIGGIICLLLY